MENGPLHVTIIGACGPKMVRATNFSRSGRWEVVVTIADAQRAAFCAGNTSIKHKRAISVSPEIT